MKNKFLVLLFVFLLMCSVSVSAKQHHMTLLSAERTENNTYIGGVADLYLEIKPGTGRVFFESFPLSQIDTQVSTRFAKEFACDFINIDCSNLDFFYTISSGGAMVGGPSAGAAMTVLTISVLDNQELNPKVVMTGTINSDGMIGPVGSVDKKIEAAQRYEFNKVLIPKWVKPNQDEFNLSSFHNGSGLLINHSYFSEDLLKIKTIEVGSILDALYEFTGKNYSRNKKLEIPDDYSKTMKNFSIMLCEKTDLLQHELNFDITEINRSKEIDFLLNLSGQTNFTSDQEKEIRLNYLKIRAFDYYNNSRTALQFGKSYSAASFCFGTNVVLRELELIDKDNITKQEIYNNTKLEINNFIKEIDAVEPNSMIKLQTKQIVFERANNAKESFDKLNYSDIDDNDLAYAIERLYSAEVWSKFFEINAKQKEIDSETIKKICKIKIMEAQERTTYIDSMFPADLESIENDIDSAISLRNNEDYELCIYVASQAKANADVIINSLLIDEDKFFDFLDYKINLVKNEIANEIDNDVFPIAALSYIEYAESLKDFDPSSAIIYSEYASEFSNLNMYSDKDNQISLLKFYFEDKNLLMIIITFSFMFSGIIIFLVTLIFGFIVRNRKKK